MGQSVPDVDTCLKLCEILNVTPNRLLLGFNEDKKAAPQAKKDPLTTIFVVTSIFLMVVCACGTVLLICNLYNERLFEPIIHVLSLNMIRGSLLAFVLLFIAALLHRFRTYHKRGRK